METGDNSVPSRTQLHICTLIRISNLYSTYTIVSHFNLLVQFLLLFIPKRWVANQENVENDTWSGGEGRGRGRGGEGEGEGRGGGGEEER